MKQRRLLVLLAVMVSLVALRLAVPPGGQAPTSPQELVVAVIRPEPVAARQPEALPADPIPPQAIDARDAPGNAFAVRVVRQPTPPPPPPAPKAVAFVGPPEPVPVPPPPPPPPPPIQVIGTWDDSAAPGVFMSTAQGTVLARPRTVLLAEYRVTAITPQQVSITHVATKHVWQLPVPRPMANR